LSIKRGNDLVTSANNNDVVKVLFNTKNALDPKKLGNILLALTMIIEVYMLTMQSTILEENLKTKMDYVWFMHSYMVTP
jgi:hypothetical protein